MYEETGKQGKCHNTCGKLPDHRFRGVGRFLLVGAFPNSPDCALRHSYAISAKSLIRAAHRCSVSFSRWVSLASGSLPKMRSMLALTVSSSRISSLACR